MPPNRRSFLKGTTAAAVGALGALGASGSSARAGDLGAKEVCFQRRIPVRHEVDVFVAGGGPSGVAVAVAAARQGRRVFLAERNTCLGGGNIGHTFGLDSTDERSITKALLWARKSLPEYERYYKNYLKGFEQMELAATASQLGCRESRRILGDYLLNLEDFKRRAVFADEIGRYAYPVDIHAGRPDLASYQKYEQEFRTLRYGKGESYGIPYRSLTPQKLCNVLVAGRCISTDRHVQSSVRVMPGCFITGQAAGVAAAIAVENRTDTRGVPVAELQRRLKAAGAYLPNC